jgi:hypothetical protein
MPGDPEKRRKGANIGCRVSVRQADGLLTLTKYSENKNK